MTNHTPHLLQKTFALLMRQALSKPWMRLRCIIALLLIGVDVTSTTFVSYYSKKILETLPLQGGSILFMSIGLFGVFWILEATISHIQDIVFFPVINQTTRDLTYQTVEHIHKISLLDYQKLSIPETINCIRRISQSARAFIKTIVLILVPSFMKIIVAAFVLIKAGFLAFVFVPCLGLILFLLYKTTQWYTMTRARAWKVSDQVILRINDSLLNTERCRFFQPQEMKNIAQYLNIEADCWQKTNQRLHSVHVVIGLLLGITLVGTLMGIVFSTRTHLLSIGEFVFLKGQLIAALIPLRYFSKEFRLVAEALVDIERVIALLAIPVLTHKMGSENKHPSKNHGIHIKNLFFQHENLVVFKNASLEIKPGQKIGIVGENGSGKSTLLRLMMGLYQPQRGTIAIHGKNIHTYKKSDLHTIIYYIPQQYHLFNSSLRNNLCHGIGESISDDYLLEILERVKMLPLLEQWPQGMDTPLGEMGATLSGGEKQKVALARALLLKPRILLLDETTNALSIEHEQLILETLFEVIPTIVFSSHRPSCHTHLDPIFKIHEKQLWPTALQKPLFQSTSAASPSNMHKIANPMPSIPLSLYIHIPWCTKKCPYCDFNSYASDTIPEKAYIQRLLMDLEQDKPLVQGRSIQSIFFGGGTPSLFSPKGIEAILEGLGNHLTIDTHAEITLEANPGTVSLQHFKDYQKIGINRISLGAQSFQDKSLKALGRIHSAAQTQQAIEAILKTHFNSFNIDLMYGLPEQSIQDACFDLKMALDFDPPHLSWYHLTLEPNTLFHSKRPQGLPSDDQVFEMQLAGSDLLHAQGLTAYEVSAFSKTGYHCKHNMNYWHFGDYLGIGAGAHAKITDLKSNTITRYWKTRYPKDYLNLLKNPLAGSKIIPNDELALEFMLNALRLYEGCSLAQFEHRTFLSRESIKKPLHEAQTKGLVRLENDWVIPTDLGKRFLNDLTALFLD